MREEQEQNKEKHRPEGISLTASIVLLYLDTCGFYQQIQILVAILF
jgi:hypothetical protein